LPAAAEYPDVLGYAYAINGKIHGVDVFGSRDVFAKAWPRLLRAHAIEAVSLRDEQGGAAAKAVTAGEVAAFARSPEKGETEDEPAIRAATAACGELEYRVKADHYRVVNTWRETKGRAAVHTVIVPKLAAPNRDEELLERGRQRTRVVRPRPAIEWPVEPPAQEAPKR
jgi:hypothetical protein